MGCFQSREEMSVAHVSILRQIRMNGLSRELQPASPDVSERGPETAGIAMGTPDFKGLQQKPSEPPRLRSIGRDEILLMTPENKIASDPATLPEVTPDATLDKDQNLDSSLGQMVVEEKENRNVSKDNVQEKRAMAEDSFRTPPRKKHVRRRIDGSPILPECSMPSKTVYLIRHGFSKGQEATKNGTDRKTDQRLLDAGLTEQGIAESRQIPSQFSEKEMSSIQLVYSSPLTRALHTALLAFPNKDIACHFDLREIGVRAPENTPRTMALVLKDLEGVLKERDRTCIVDVETYQPRDWPRDSAPSVIKKEKVKKFLQWLYNERTETTVAVVCHHNVIKTAVINGKKLRPKNATVIQCELNSNGELFLHSKSVEKTNNGELSVYPPP